MHQYYVLFILNALRNKNESRKPISELLEDEYHGKVPSHTGGGVFGGCINSLVYLGFIELFDSADNNISDKIKQIGHPFFGPLTIDYNVANYLMGKEKKIFVSLTNKFSEIQSVLGFSLSKMIEEVKSGSAISVRPVFGKPSGHLKSDVFVLMPFEEAFYPVFDDHIIKVCNKLSLDCKRADNIFGSSEIIDDIWELICNSNIIIADCTGRNPNVFYELGMAHTLGKKVIVITQNADDIPFDIRHIRYIKYKYTPRGMNQFENVIEKYLLEELNKKR